MAFDFIVTQIARISQIVVASDKCRGKIQRIKKSVGSVRSV